MAAKEIWYVWDKKTIIPNARKLMLNDGKSVKISGKFPLGTVCDDINWFTHYTLGETRERVECEVCCGLGHYDLVECRNCKGHGHIWEMGVKS